MASRNRRGKLPHSRGATFDDTTNREHATRFVGFLRKRSGFCLQLPALSAFLSTFLGVSRFLNGDKRDIDFTRNFKNIRTSRCVRIPTPRVLRDLRRVFVAGLGELPSAVDSFCEMSDASDAKDKRCHASLCYFSRREKCWNSSPFTEDSVFFY